MPWWKNLSRYIQGMVLIMVSILFFVWGVFGSAQVTNQTNTLLEAIQTQHAQQHSKEIDTIVQDQRVLLASMRYVTCLLRVSPDDRTPKVVNKCERQSGLGSLQDDETKVLGITTVNTLRKFINVRRVNHGCKPVRKSSTALTDSARRHSKRMARAGHLFHTDLHAGQWSLVGEVLGVGPSWRSIGRALFRSRQHRRILLNCRYDYMALGIIYRDFVWVTGRLYAK